MAQTIPSAAAAALRVGARDAAAQPGAFQIQLLAQGATNTLDVLPSTPAAALRSLAARRVRIPPHLFSLYHRGSLLHGAAPLASCGLRRDALVELKLRGRGGGACGSKPAGSVSPPPWQPRVAALAEALGAPCTRPPPADEASAAERAAAGSLHAAAERCLAAGEAWPCDRCGGGFAEQWGEQPWHCFACKAPLNPARAEAEAEAARSAQEADEIFMSGGALSAEGQRRHASRGIEVSVLEEIARVVGEEASTADVVALLVKPATARLRCRFVELPSMRGRTGEPRAFVSHTWKAPFADLVAAVTFVLQSSDYVWVDIFAVRQWPGNGADLDFDCCIWQAPCFLLVGKHIPEVASLDREVLISNMGKPPLPDAALQWCAFFRVWCLVELDASLRYGKTTLMLIGANDGERGFVPNDGMIDNLIQLIDVTKAVASVEADRARILQQLEEGTGAAALKARAVSALNGSLNVMRQPKVLQAAFGNLAPLDGIIGKVRLGDALTAAAVSGFAEALSRLLVRGAPVSHRNNTPIIAAALGGHEPCIRLLLEHSADIDACDEAGWTPVMSSSQNGYEACVRTLISCSANVHKQTNEGLTALAIASQLGQLKCIDALLEAGADIEKADNADWTPLMVACVNGHERCVRRFIEQGANIEKQNNTKGFTALMIACQMGYTPCVKALLEAGADLTKQSKDPTTALMIACDNGHAACVRMLLEYGADVNATAAQGAGALLIASQAGYEPCVRLLIEHSAIVDQAADDGTTPLMHACKGGHAPCVQALLDAGAKKDLKTLRGATAAGIAREYGHTALLQLLQ